MPSPDPARTGRAPRPDTSWSRWYLTLVVVNILLILFFYLITRTLNYPAG